MTLSKLRSFFLTTYALLFLLSCTPSQESTSDPAYVSEVRKWHEDRMAELKSEEGWLNLAGMFWLKEGENSFGNDPSNDVVFPKDTPPFMGSYFVTKTEIDVLIKPAIPVRYDGQPVAKMKLHVNQDERSIDQLTLGSLRWFVIGRDGKLGVRLRDLESPSVTQFNGVARYPTETAWRIAATFVPSNPPKKIFAATVLGTNREHASPGTFTFTVNDQTYSLDALSRDKEGRLFVVFGDPTNGLATYGGGRFVYIDPPDKNGVVFIDFNKAYNPPCAFSAFSTCPLPPEQNRLPIKITAGEKKYEAEFKSQS